jgi:predicted nucleotidyltransferase
LKQNKEIAFSFLRCKLSNNYIIKAFLFGSFVTDKAKPNDCDIFIVTNQMPKEIGWKEFLILVEKVKNEFVEKFAIPLNATINIEKEFREESAFRTRILKGKTVDII